MASVRQSRLIACMRLGLAAVLWVMAGQAGAGLRVDAMTMPAHQSPVLAKQALTLSVAEPVSVSLPALSPLKAELSDKQGVRQIGVARDVAQTDTVAEIRALLRWQILPSGARAAALQLQPDGALGLRMEVVFQALPAAAVFRLYPHQGATAVVEVTGAALLERLPVNAETGLRTWWTPDIGTAPVLEIVLPAAVADEALQLSIPRVSQFVVSPANTQDMGTMGFAEKGSSNSCERDVNCQSTLLEQRNAVIRMVYVSEAKTFQCTGTLINSPAQDQTPYVLTAAHCVKDQAMASTLQTAWFNYSQSCGSQQLFAGTAERYGGARWLASSLPNDMTLLQLHDAPPAGAVFAGWDAGSVATGAALAGIHHPRGDMQKINLGSLMETAGCSVDYASHQLYCAPSAHADGGFYRMTMSSGSVEPGSSGSAAFVDGRVVGTLTGGEAMCPANATQAVYGRLDQAIGHAFYPWLGAPALASNSEIAPVYRFYIPQSGAHFYTISMQERDQAIALLAGVLQFEGAVFGASQQSAPGLVAVHRFFNPQLVAHFYTASDAERQYVQAHFPNLRYEGVAWWAPEQAPSDRAVYRFYRYSTMTHRYTMDAAERDAWRGNPDFSYEGLAYYVWAAP